MGQSNIGFSSGVPGNFKPFIAAMFLATLFFSVGIGLLHAEAAIAVAEWRNGERKLVVKGVAEQGAAVIVCNAFADQQWVARATKKNVWSIHIAKPNPVPCAVTVNNEQTLIVVENTPNYCGPKPPPASDPLTDPVLVSGM